MISDTMINDNPGIYTKEELVTLIGTLCGAQKNTNVFVIGKRTNPSGLHYALGISRGGSFQHCKYLDSIHLTSPLTLIDLIAKEIIMDNAPAYEICPKNDKMAVKLDTSNKLFKKHIRIFKSYLDPNHQKKCLIS